MNRKLIEKLRSGEVAIDYRKEKDDAKLWEVFKTAFPNCDYRSIWNYEFYYRGSTNNEVWSGTNGTPTTYTLVTIEDFFKDERGNYYNIDQKLLKSFKNGEVSIHVQSDDTRMKLDDVFKAAFPDYKRNPSMKIDDLGYCSASIHGPMFCKVPDPSMMIVHLKEFFTRDEKRGRFVDLTTENCRMQPLSGERIPFLETNGLAIMTSGNYAYKGFFLSKKYEWKVVEDSFGNSVLLPIMK